MSSAFTKIILLPIVSVALCYHVTAQEVAAPAKASAKADAPAVAPAEAQVAKAAPQEAQAKVTVVGSNSVEYSWTVDELAAFGEDGAGRWRCYMHGVTDENATPVVWRDGMTPAQRVSSLLSGDRVRIGGVVQTDIYSVCLKGGESYSTASPLVAGSAISGHPGNTLRFFIWIKGDGVGRQTTLREGAPRVRMVLRDGWGAEVAQAESQFCTRGTYPWFCYHIDMPIPTHFSTDGDEAVSGLYVTLTNPKSGTALFGYGAYEFIGVDRPTLGKGMLSELWADPKLGTFAPNPDYDELPMHFWFGLPDSESIKWNFIGGNKAFRSMVYAYNAVSYIDGYFSDWFHATESIPNLVFLCKVGKKLGRVPEFQDGWEDRVLSAIEKKQNPKTGLWECGGKGNLLLTSRIVRNCYSPYVTPTEVDSTEKDPTPWCAVEGHKLPHARELFKSVLDAQVRIGDMRVGWNRYAFQGQEMIDASRDVRKCELMYTAAATRLLVQCYEAEDDRKMMDQCDDAVRDAYTYVLAHLIDANWRMYEDERKLTLCGGYEGLEFLEASGACVLEYTTERDASAVQVEFTKSTALLKLDNIPQNVVSIRVYGAPLKGVETDVVPGDDRLIAIFNCKKTVPTASDPLMLTEMVISALQRNDGTEAMSPDVAGTMYLAKKLANASRVQTGFFKDGKGVFTVPVLQRGKQLTVVTVDAFGYVSQPKLIDVPVQDR